MINPKNYEFKTVKNENFSIYFSEQVGTLDQQTNLVDYTGKFRIRDNKDAKDISAKIVITDKMGKQYDSVGNTINLNGVSTTEPMTLTLRGPAGKTIITNSLTFN